MLLGEPRPTQFDIHFSLFGFPVRVSPFFWLLALIFSQNAKRWGIQGILVFILAVFVSILIHEIGHGLMFRRYGIGSHIVLYQFGGLAIPDSFSRPGALRGWPHILISAAGPGIGFVVTVIAVLPLYSLGYRIPVVVPFLDIDLMEYLPAMAAERRLPEYLWLFLVQFAYCNIGWGLLNLLPVYPLDGGQISRELFLLYGRGEPIKNSLLLSIITAAGLAVFGLTHKDMFLFLMFAMLGYSSYQALQMYSGGPRYRNPW